VLLRGRWLAGHALVLVVAGAFVALGFWQLARHHEKQQKVRAAESAYAAPAPDIGATTTSPAPGSRAQATGTYEPAHDVLLRDRPRGNDVGVDVLTPLRLRDGTAVLVDRGWVRAPSNLAPTPDGVVVVRGVAGASRPLSSPAEVRDIDGRTSVPRVDLARIGRDLPYPLRDVWIEARYQAPRPSAGAPQLPEPPPPDRVNHMQYAIEWFALAAIPIVGWPIVLRRVTRRPG
jgi:cytochrome oxidase assembly protein ShyY1